MADAPPHDEAGRLAEVERRLRESERLYRQLAEHVHDVIWTLDLATGRYAYISPSITRLRGLTVEEALAEVKRLSGLIPICSYCKSVRDDAGYWEAVEKYMTERSAARFSHSPEPGKGRLAASPYTPANVLPPSRSAARLFRVGRWLAGCIGARGRRRRAGTPWGSLRMSH
jgi:hypothetical protein